MDTVKISKGNVKMVAHRGLSGIERENTCPAFVAAGNRSYYGIETDVHVTADGKFVIIHDETLTRVSGGRYDLNVEKLPLDSLKDVVLPDRDGSTVRQDIRVPTLAEYVHICKKYGKVCVLELKNHFNRADAERLVSEIDEAGYLNGVTFISFDRENCVNLRDIASGNDVQWLTGDPLTDETLDFLVRHRLSLDAHYSLLDEETVARYHESGVSINCWTCDDPERAQSLVAMGVDYITTNILE